MAREILTFPITAEQLHRELAFVAEHFGRRGFDACTVLFGFAWGNEYYPGNDWNEAPLPLADLVETVRRVETAGLGALGQDDLYVTVAGLRFRFCNDSDLHLSWSGAPGGEDVELFYERWKGLGYRPAEWSKSPDIGPKWRVRFD